MLLPFLAIAVALGNSAATVFGYFLGSCVNSDAAVFGDFRRSCACAAVVVGDCLSSWLLLAIAVARCALCCSRWRLLSLFAHCAACRCWRLPSLLRTVQCAAAAPRGSARVGTPQLATTSTSREL